MTYKNLYYDVNTNLYFFLVTNGVPEVFYPNTNPYLITCYKSEDTYYVALIDLNAKESIDITIHLSIDKVAYLDYLNADTSSEDWVDFVNRLSTLGGLDNMDVELRGIPVLDTALPLDEMLCIGEAKRILKLDLERVWVSVRSKIETPEDMKESYFNALIDWASK